MSVANDRRYIRGRRCPVCGGADSDARGAGRRCFGFLSADGSYAHCSREELAGPIERSASDTYGHRLIGSCKCGHEHATPLEQQPLRSVDIGTVIAEYDYYDEDGVVLYQVRKYGPVKTYRQFRPDGSGGWVPGLEPKDRDGKPTGAKIRRVLYRLDRLIESDHESIVWIVEGEKDVHAMESLGFVATCNPGGAGKWSLVADCAKKALRDRHVVIIADDDSKAIKPTDRTKGKDHALDVAKRLKGIAASIRVIDPVRGHDAASWIEEGGTAEEFLAALPAVTAAALQTTEGSGSYALAVDFVRRCHTHPDGPTLRRWRGGWYVWEQARGCYRELTDERLDTRIRDGLGLSEPKECSDVRKMAISVPQVAVDDVELGGWTVGAGEESTVACPNGVLTLLTRKLSPVTPRLFTTASAGAAYDPNAPKPVAWLDFLNRSFNGDQESIDTLQEWFGYNLTADTLQQKIMFLAGLPRSGKGTVIRILSAIIGEENSATPTIDHLSTNFGMQPLIGKTAAIIGDARIDQRTNMAALMSKLLGISGRDKQTIDRKKISPWIGYLSVRFTIASNAILKFKDVSDALMKRFLLIWFPVSFLGREDLSLEGRLRTELPGILLWAIDGWHRLNERGHFLQPSSCAHMLDDMAALSNPISGWLRDQCEIDSNGQIFCGAAYKDFVQWAERSRIKDVPSSREFGMDLKATGIVTRVSTRGIESHAYRGIRLIL